MNTQTQTLLSKVPTQATCCHCGCVRPIHEMRGYDRITADASRAHCADPSQCQSGHAKALLSEIDQLLAYANQPCQATEPPPFTPTDAQAESLGLIQSYHEQHGADAPAAERIEDFWLVVNMLVPHYPIIKRRDSDSIEVNLAHIYTYAAHAGAFLPAHRLIAIDLKCSPHYQGRRVTYSSRPEDGDDAMVLWRFCRSVLKIAHLGIENEQQAYNTRLAEVSHA